MKKMRKAQPQSRQWRAQSAADHYELKAWARVQPSCRMMGKAYNKHRTRNLIQATDWPKTRKHRKGDKTSPQIRC